MLEGSGIGFVPRNVIDQKYYNLFGEYPDESLFDYTNNDGCPAFFCETENCFRIWACGGTGDDSLISYNYKYGYKENEYYVYQSIGVDSPGNQGTYKDIELKNLYKKWTENGGWDFKINESNYQDFSKYKWTFIKKDEKTYYFKSLEKIAD